MKNSLSAWRRFRADARYRRWTHPALPCLRNWLWPGAPGELFVLDSRDPSLHMRAAELIASLKSEGIAPEEIDRLADGAAGGMQKKLRDIALVYRRMQALAGEDFSDSRDMERMAQAEFASTSLVTRREVLVYGFDVLPELRMRSICALAAAAREVSVFSEAAEDGVLDRQWGNLRRLAAMAERGGIPVRMHEVPSPAGGGEAATLFQNLYAYPWHTQADAPVDIRLLSLPDRAEEVRFAAAEILRYTCREGGICATSASSWAIRRRMRGRWSRSFPRRRSHSFCRVSAVFPKAACGRG